MRRLVDDLGRDLLALRDLVRHLGGALWEGRLPDLEGLEDLGLALVLARRVGGLGVLGVRSVLEVTLGHCGDPLPDRCEIGRHGRFVLYECHRLPSFFVHHRRITCK